MENWTDKIQVFNGDCMELMSKYEDGYFDLAIVDPPYGIGMDGGNIGKGKCYNKKQWDSEAPTKEYFDELKRVSNDYIIWGGNYFAKHFDNMENFIIWDKMQKENITFAMCEMAITSIKKPAQIFSKTFHSGNNQFVTKEDRIHPTQKPVALYNWLLDRYAKPDFKILDTHLGSGSHAIAAHYFGCELVASELDSEYYEASKKRFQLVTSQQKLF